MASRYPAMVFQVHSTSGKAKIGSSSIMVRSVVPETGAAEKPHSPTSWVVTPCAMALMQPGSETSETSEWVCRSTMPGMTASPVASTSSTFASMGKLVPTAPMRSPATATSAMYGLVPVPS